MEKVMVCRTVNGESQFTEKMLLLVCVKNALVASGKPLLTGIWLCM